MLPENLEIVQGDLLDHLDVDRTHQHHACAPPRTLPGERIEVLDVPLQGYPTLPIRGPFAVARPGDDARTIATPQPGPVFSVLDTTRLARVGLWNEQWTPGTSASEVAGLLATGRTIVTDASAAEVSYPGFWDTLHRLASGQDSR